MIILFCIRYNIEKFTDIYECNSSNDDCYICKNPRSGLCIKSNYGYNTLERCKSNCDSRSTFRAQNKYSGINPKFLR